ncbi:MAG: hypothetical protein II939_15545 [Bacteroidales bacterium]|nr:hypothetical protein [Bacteroidales bacterium]
MLNVFVENINDAVREQLRIARQHRLKDIKLFFDENVRKSSEIKTWKDVESLKGSTSGINSYCWNIDKTEVFCDNDAFVLLVNHSDFKNFVLLDDKTYPKGRKSLFLDASHCNDLPCRFYHFPVFSAYADIVNYGVEKGLVKSFCLDDKKTFCKTTIAPVQGQAVYQDLNTRYYWYLDNFHKDHYEVFDKTGKNHLGEADLSGKMRPNTVDKNKHITI